MSGLRLCLARLARLRKNRLSGPQAPIPDGRKGFKYLISLDQAGMAELVDARDLKSLGAQALCRFDPGCPHHESWRRKPPRQDAEAGRDPRRPQRNLSFTNVALPVWNSPAATSLYSTLDR